MRTEHATAREIAAIRTTATRSDLGRTIVGTLDKIWPALRGVVTLPMHMLA